ncbi:MAG: FeoB small GTPase domain-containing protein [Candidatus Scatosoma sp.]
MLTGTPNVGKTTLYNALRGRHNRTGDFHGVTAAVSRAKSRVRGIENVSDLPGLYSLKNGKIEEKIAAEELLRAHNAGAVTVQIASALQFSRSLPLLRELISLGVRPVVAITQEERLKKRGGAIDAAALSAYLGVPCVCVNALSKKSVRAFAERLMGSIPAQPLSGNGAGKRFFSAEGGIPGYKPPQRSGNGGSSALLSSWLLPVFFALTAGVFYLTFGKNSLGALAKSGVERVFSYLARAAGERIQSAFFRNVVCGGVLRGVGSVLSFLPQIALLYLFSELLEESGAMSALSYATDGLFSLIGLSGRAAFCIFLGYGCTAAGIASSAALENPRAQRRAVACLYYIPCSAKLPVYLTLLSSLVKNAFLGALALYALGTGAGLAVAAFCGGKEDDFIMEIADFSLPSPVFILKKLLFRIKGFIIKVSGAVLLFTALAYVLASVNFHGACAAEESILAKVSKTFTFLFYPMGVKDWRAAFAAAGGFVAKENVSGLIYALYPDGIGFSRASAAAYLTFIALIPPCITAVSAAAKEIGAKTAWKYAVFQTAGAFLGAYTVYFLLKGGAATGICAAILSVTFAAFLIAALKKRKRTVAPRCPNIRPTRSRSL